MPSNNKSVYIFQKKKIIIIKPLVYIKIKVSFQALNYILNKKLIKEVRLTYLK